MSIRRPSPKWIITTVAVVAVTALFVRLGFWQLDRLDERQATNVAAQSRLGQPSLDVDALIGEVGADLDESEYRRAVAVGVFDVAGEVLIRSQVYRGSAGFHVITPLIKSDGSAVLVNRGWVPLGMDEVPVNQASPIVANGTSRVEGWVHLSQLRPALGPVDDASEDLAVLSRVDIDRIQQQVGYSLEPVYVVQIRQGDPDLPVPLALPSFEDEGSHLAYAIQWFGFALILSIGSLLLVRRQRKRPSG